VGQPIGVVDILVAGQAAEHGLTQQPGQQVTGVLAAAAVRENTPGQIGQAEGVVEFAIRQQPGVGSDAAAVEFEPQAPVEIDLQKAVIRFTRRVFHARATVLMLSF
jgi:hypothetical protein